MKIFTLVLPEVWQSLNAYRLRNCLTTLGVTVGVFAAVVTLTVGEGMRAEMRRSMQSVGTNTLNIMPNMIVSAGVVGSTRNANYLSSADADALRDLPDLKAVAPITQNFAELIAGDENRNAMVLGSTADILEVRDLQISDGEMFSDGDRNTPSLIAVLGHTLAGNLFPSGNAVGSTVRINNIPIRVVGVLKAKGDDADGNETDTMAIVPIKTSQRRLFGSVMPNNVEQITVKVKSVGTMHAAENTITEILRERKHIKPDDDPPFSVINFEAMVETAQKTEKLATLFLACSAAISLIVGGIGIMNTMLVSVTERTKEIGIRRAIGASQSVILAQFLTEAIILSLAGCVIGITTGYSVIYVAAKFTDYKTSISLVSLLIAISSAFLTGVVFGFSPALKAALLPPAEALRSSM